MKKKVVVLTGAGMSVESGLSTFRDAGGLWDNYPVMKVASHQGWLDNPCYVNDFYNMLRVKYKDVKPNQGHVLLKSLEEYYDVTIVTQNVDNPRFHVTLPHEGFGETGLEVPHGAKAEDGSLLRPFIVFFEENVPNMYDAAQVAQEADVFVIIGTSLNVYPAAGLVQYVRPEVPVYLIDPKPVTSRRNMTHIQAGASEGMRRLFSLLAAKEHDADK